MKCKFCNKKEFKSQGYKNYNERFICKKCGGIYIPLFIRLFGKYRGYPKFLTKREWEWVLNGN